MLPETIEFYDLKLGIYGKLNEYMEIYKYQRSRSFHVILTFVQGHSDFINLK